jgi:hypothetical protein
MKKPTDEQFSKVAVAWMKAILANHGDLDSKRPLGSSMISQDIIKILQIEGADDDDVYDRLHGWADKLWDDLPKWIAKRCKL